MQTEQHTTEWKLDGERNQEWNLKLNEISWIKICGVQRMKYKEECL